MDAVEKLIREQLVTIERSRGAMAGPVVKSVGDKDGNRIIVVTNTAALYTGSPFVLNEEGYRLRVAKAGSDPFALKVDLGKVGIYGPVYPGVEIVAREKFDRIAVTPWASATVPLAGTFTEPGGYTEDANELTLVIGKTPEARYVEPEGDGGFVFVRESVNQNYNNTNNIPALPSDGISCRGARAIRIVVDGLGDTITGGTVRWWHLAYGLGSWGPTDVVQTLPTGAAFSCPGELELAFRGGRLFPSLEGFTSSGGSGSPVVYMYVYGEGGDLYPGEVL